MLPPGESCDMTADITVDLRPVGRTWPSALGSRKKVYFTVHAT